jgi:rhodanese-related sulfurtransferase
MKRMSEQSFEERVAEARGRIREVPASEAIAMRGNGKRVVYLDVREQREWNLFRVPGAVHIPLASVREQAARAIESDQCVVVYCARGGRAALAADALRELGYTDVVSVAGGVLGWVFAGGELEE